jgi:glycosyltransferase involved in cell wall biosynthesis
MSNKKISVVIPTIGRVEFLDQAIESILEQTVAADEIIIFDNSELQLLKNISKYGETESINWVQSGSGLDAVKSWNSAVESASCEYVTILGDDDIACSNYIKEAKNIIKSNNFGILKAIIIDEAGFFKKSLIYPEKKEISYSELRKYRIKGRISLYVPGLVFKKSYFFDANCFENTGMPGSAFSDELLCYKLALISNKCVISDEICWEYRKHSTSLGVMNNFEAYVGRAIEYVDLMSNSLSDAGDKICFSNEVQKQKYLDYVCNYGFLQFLKYQTRNNNNIFLIIRDFYLLYLSDKRISRKAKFLFFFKLALAYVKNT